MTVGMRKNGVCLKKTIEETNLVIDGIYTHIKKNKIYISEY